MGTANPLAIGKTRRGSAACAHSNRRYFPFIFSPDPPAKRADLESANAAAAHFPRVRSFVNPEPDRSAACPAAQTLLRKHRFGFGRIACADPFGERSCGTFLGN